MILGIDPGELWHGAVRYDWHGRRVLEAHKALSTADAIAFIRQHADSTELLAVERVASYGISGASLLRTAENGGRFWQVGLDAGLPVDLVYRREVLSRLHVGPRGTKDSIVRQRMIELHGGGKEAAIGRKASPGPLYGVSSHAWAALAVAWVAGARHGDNRRG